MAVKPILLLGHPQLYERSLDVDRSELAALGDVINDLRDTMMVFRSRYGVGRAIAAPQIGVRKNLVYMHIDTPVILINPVLDRFSKETFDLWDDCMCFPHLLVRVRRNLRCRVRFRDAEWIEREMLLEGALSELLQHECDHLEGILATMRAIDSHSFAVAGRGDEGGYGRPDTRCS